MPEALARHVRKRRHVASWVYGTLRPGGRSGRLQLAPGYVGKGEGRPGPHGRTSGLAQHHCIASCST